MEGKRDILIKLSAAITALLLSMSVISGMIHAKQGEAETSAISAGALAETTNIHYTGKYCEECHEKKPVKGGSTYLKYNSDFNQLCRCHIYKAGEYTHPVDIVPSEEKKAKIPPDLPLLDGKVSCTTCHDIYLQCNEDVESKFSNRRFLRGAPFNRRTDLCFKCHDDTRYRKLDPHVQLDENGDIILGRCLYCHVEKPDELRASFKDVKLVGNLLELCQRCHVKSRKHPADAEHLVIPPVKILNKMKKTENQFGIILPLDYEGKIYCATCHNPHQKGVIPYERAGAPGASEHTKQRFPGKICVACHEK